MRANALLLTLAAWAASLSCGGPQGPREHRPGGHATAYTVRIWIQPDARLPRAAIMSGCGKWLAERVTCLEVGTPELAKIRVYADDRDCVAKDDQGKPTGSLYLAWAFQGGDIKMMMGCMGHTGGVYDTHEFSAVVTHEVGHQFGIWDHVPTDCKDKDAKTHSGDGRKICGPAVMNAYYHKDIDYVTDIDAMAFDERDVDYSVLVGDMPKKDTPSCVYELPAP